ncbi:hypothetical protein ABZ260_49490, partial [Streptosporangium sp. NPDC006013]|uniref:hypothetical protein n=1 Tax=Streptosporangium sp. NPDC006013 TaxID=3155596 RepID=UPI0033A21642
LLGEDVSDPYGGAFKVTRGLSTRLSGQDRAALAEQLRESLDAEPAGVPDPAGPPDVPRG